MIKTKYVELWNEDDIISAKVVTDEEFDNIEEGRVMKESSNTIAVIAFIALVIILLGAVIFHLVKNTFWLHEIITSVK